MPKDKGYKKANPVKKGHTRITQNPGKKNETSVEFKRGVSSKDVPGAGMAKGAAKKIEQRKKKLKKAGR